MRKLAALLVSVFCLLPTPSFAAIAYDSVMNTSTHNSASSPVSDTFNNTAGTVAVFCVTSRTTGDQITGLTYNGIAATLLQKQNTSAASAWQYVFKLASPATGNNTISTSFSGSPTDVRVAATSYSGASDTEASNLGTVASASSWTGTVTTVTDNDWVGACSWNDISDNDATAPAVMRTTTPNNSPGLLDLNSAQTPAGSESISGTIHGGGSGAFGWITFAIKPTASASSYVPSTTICVGGICFMQ